MRYNRFYKATNFLTPTLYTQELSEYAVNLRFEDIPTEAIEQAKALLLHTMGSIFAAESTPVAEKAIRMALEANGGEGGPVTLWTSGKKVGAANAALALGTMADALDWEGYSWTGPASAAVIPCAWLAAQERHKSGKDLLRAIVAGYEVYQRIAMAVQPDQKRWDKGWGVTSWQIFAAIIPIAVLYDFDARLINQAIGVGCECSTIPARYHFTTMSDFSHYEFGYRARDGFMVVKAVEKGIRNCRDALDESRCYRGIICGTDAANGDGEEIVSGDESDPTWFTRDLGDRYLITKSMPKKWPANLWAQAFADAACRLVKEYKICLEEIEKIAIGPVAGTFMDVPEAGYESDTQAQMSVPFAMAAAMRDIAPGVKWYTAESLKDPQTISLARKIHLTNDGKSVTERDLFASLWAGEPAEAQITIVMRDGSCYTEKSEFCQGILSAEEATEHFQTQAGDAVSAEKAGVIIDAIRHLEECGDIAELSEKLFA